MPSLRFDYGDTATGKVVVDDGQYNRLASPRRKATGEVVTTYPTIANLASVRTESGDIVAIRVEEVSRG